MAGGEAGVDRAIEILASEVRRTMRLLQVSSLDELTPEHVTQLNSLDINRVNGVAADEQSLFS